MISFLHWFSLGSTFISGFWLYTARHILCEKQGKINEAYKKLQDGWLSNGDKVPPAEFAKVFFPFGGYTPNPFLAFYLKCLRNLFWVQCHGYFHVPLSTEMDSMQSSFPVVVNSAVGRKIRRLKFQIVLNLIWWS